MEDSNTENGGYGVPYDPEPALKRLSSSHEEAISELWENLYHQGDVGLASYAAVPALVQAGELSLDEKWGQRTINANIRNIQY